MPTPIQPILMLPRALFKRNAPFVFESALLPDCELIIEQDVAHLDRPRIANFHRVVGWHGTHLHPCFLHTLAFKQHLQLMLQPAFPFAVLGLVHKGNRIEHLSPIDAKVSGTLRSHVASFGRHDRGITFIIASQFETSQDVIWKSESEFIAINKHSQDASSRSQVTKQSDNEQHSEAITSQQTWQCSARLGRQYAAVSGDFNPIHLSQLSAKLFGFKQAIAHGMWTKARCLSAMQAHSEQAFRCKVEFKRPLFLPNSVQFTQTSLDANTLEMSVTSQQQLHLQGKLSK